MVVGVVLSDFVFKGPDGAPWPPSWRKVIVGAVIAAMIVNRMDEGDAAGKLKVWVRFRRYANSISQGVTWRVILELGG